MPPAVSPQFFVPRPVRRLAGAQRQQRGGGEAFGLHPVVFVGVTQRAVRGKTVVHAAMRLVPGVLDGGGKQSLGTRQMPVGRMERVELQQQLGPFRMVAGLIAPGAVDVGFVVPVVIPIHRPVGAVMLPDHVPGQRRLTAGNGVRQRFGAVEVARFACRRERGEHRFAGVHVGVLPAIRRKRPVRRGFVGVEAGLRLPEVFFGQPEGFGEPAFGFADAAHRRMGVGQHDEGHAIAMARGVEHARPAVAPVDQPGIAAARRVAESRAQKIECVLQPLLISRLAGRPVKHGMGDDEARGIDQMAGMRVEHRTVVEIKVIHPARGINGTARVKTHAPGEVLLQEGGRAEIGGRRDFHGSIRVNFIEAAGQLINPSRTSRNPKGKG